MNTKIKNYVDVLFSDIPYTKKAQELKQEILSNLVDRYEAYIAEGKSDTEAYSLAIAEQGDIEPALAELAPTKEVKEKIDEYRKLKARNTAVAVGLYIFSPAPVVLLGGISEFLHSNLEELLGVIGVVFLFICIAIATGLLIFTNMNVPQDIEPFLAVKSNKSSDFDNSTESGKLLSSILKLFWTLVTIAYLVLSFATGRWDISWIIWLIAVAVNQAIIMIYNVIESNRR